MKLHYYKCVWIERVKSYDFYDHDKGIVGCEKKIPKSPLEYLGHWDEKQLKQYLDSRPKSASTLRTLRGVL